MSTTIISALLFILNFINIVVQVKAEKGNIKKITIVQISFLVISLMSFIAAIIATNFVTVGENYEIVSVNTGAALTVAIGILAYEFLNIINAIIMLVRSIYLRNKRHNAPYNTLH